MSRHLIFSDGAVYHGDPKVLSLKEKKMNLLWNKFQTFHEQKFCQNSKNASDKIAILDAFLASVEDKKEAEKQIFIAFMYCTLHSWIWTHFLLEENFASKFQVFQLKREKFFAKFLRNLLL